MKFATETQVSHLEDGGVELETMGRRFRVNAVGADILRRLTEEGTSVVIEQISTVYQAPRDTVVRDIAAFLDMLSDNLLIDLSDDPAAAGLSGVRPC